uniref:Uncharacterized protein n=1 Tax=viral metagenome TaxID=1070528 RepID=A0A6M3XY60_9ZZZZ
MLDTKSALKKVVNAFKKAQVIEPESIARMKKMNEAAKRVSAEIKSEKV